MIRAPFLVFTCVSTYLYYRLFSYHQFYQVLHGNACPFRFQVQQDKVHMYQSIRNSRRGRHWNIDSKQKWPFLTSNDLFDIDTSPCIEIFIYVCPYIGLPCCHRPNTLQCSRVGFWKLFADWWRWHAWLRHENHIWHNVVYMQNRKISITWSRAFHRFLHLS